MPNALHPIRISFVEDRKAGRLIRWFTSLMMIGFVILIVAIAFQKQVAADLRAEIDAMNTQLDLRRKEAAVRPVDPAEDRRRKAETAIAAALDYPWDRVFGEVEAAADVEGVALLSMTHDQQSRKTMLAIESLDVPSALRYVDKLNDASGGKGQWMLMSYQLQQKNFPQTIKAQVERLPIGGE